MTAAHEPEHHTEPGNYLLFGPPGTGKTTQLAKQVREWSRQFGSDRLMIASFTRAGAAEIAGRDLPLRKDQVGTLHSFAFRSLDLHAEQVAEKHLADWNDAYPEYRIGGGIKSSDDMAFTPGTSDGDVLLASTQIKRGRMVPIEWWTSDELEYMNTWRKWCEANDLVDYTTMIEVALDVSDIAPGNPSIGIFDECQDFVPLHLALVQKWSAHMEITLQAGDDDQTIYGFAGATPNAFIDQPVPDTHKRVLSQSYRVPAAVHAVSTAWIAQVERRESKEYRPRNDEHGDTVAGVLRALPHAHQASVMPIVAEIEQAIADERTIMVLATAAYFLDKLIAELKARAVPFANPWRTADGRWNPLKVGGTQTHTADRILSFLRYDEEAWGDLARMWSWGDVVKWTHHLGAKGLMQRGAKKWLTEKPAGQTVKMDELHEHVWLDPASDVVVALESGDLHALDKHLLVSERPKYQYPLQIALQHGAGALRKRPLVTVGTYHSVKGGEAQIVVLLCELSPSAWKQWDLGTVEDRDEMRRLAYVGMTRASEELIVCSDAGAALPLQSFVVAHA